MADGDYIKDIEVNDLRNRYTITKSTTQKMVNISTIYPLIFPGSCVARDIIPLELTPSMGRGITSYSLGDVFSLSIMIDL